MSSETRPAIRVSSAFHMGTFQASLRVTLRGSIRCPLCRPVTLFPVIGGRSQRSSSLSFRHEQFWAPGCLRAFLARWHCCHRTTISYVLASPSRLLCRSLFLSLSLLVSKSNTDLGGARRVPTRESALMVLKAAWRRPGAASMASVTPAWQFSGDGSGLTDRREVVVEWFLTRRWAYLMHSIHGRRRTP